MLRGLNYLLRTTALLGLTGLGYLGYTEVNDYFSGHEQALQERDQKIAQLTKQNEAQAQQIEDLEIALKLLKVNHRLAWLEVLEQRPADDGSGEIETTLRFQETSPGGAPLGPAREFTLRGTVAYIDALILKFEDRYVEHGEALRGSSICLFRRIFGEQQKPDEGFAIDSVGTRPLPYSPEEFDPSAHDALWERFWEYANDRELAKQAGVRAAHGEAPYIELRSGKRYRVELRASGGLSLKPE